MLTDLPDIYMIVTPEPSDSLITQRTAVIESLAVDGVFKEYFSDLVELVHVGLQSGASDRSDLSASVRVLIEAIQQQQPSFPNDPRERLLDLRVTAAAVILQYLTEPPEKQGYLSSVVSALILSTSQLRTTWPDARYGALVHRLRTTARTALNEEGLSLRSVRKYPTSDVKGADVNAVAAASTATLRSLTEAVSANMSLQREELQVLWWVFGRQSSELKSPYSELTSGDAAIASAVELSALMIKPPLPSAVDFLRSVLDGKPKLPLNLLINDASLHALKLMQSVGPVARSTILRNPSLLPLSWLATRLVDSEKSPWETEFEKKAQLAPSIERHTSEWAEQIFNECIACALIERDLAQTEGQ
jgi:GTPase-associated system-like protein